MKKFFLSLLFLQILVTGTSQTNGNEMYDESYVHEIRITFEQEFFWDSLQAYFTHEDEKVYLMASIEIDGNTVDSVGIRKKGFSSALVYDGGTKMPFKVDFNEYVSGQKYDGLKKLNLHNGWHDPSMMREAVGYKVMRDAGAPASRTSYAKLYMNDIYWGLYIVVEHIDSRFLKNWYDNNNGNLYKVRSNYNLSWEGDDPLIYTWYMGLKTNKELNDFSQFVDLVREINDETDFEDSISTYLNMESYTRVMAANVLMQNFDSYFSRGRNYYIYYDSTNSRHEWIPWDYNLAFTNYSFEIINDSPSYAQVLAKHVMDSPVYRSMYFNHLCVMIDNYFTSDNLDIYIDNTVALIEDALEEDENKLFSMEDFYQNIDGDVVPEEDWGFPPVLPGLKPFIVQRVDEVRSELEAYEHHCTAIGLEEQVQAFEYEVYPNPSQTGVFTLKFNEPLEYLMVYSSQGALIDEFSVTGQDNVDLDLSSHSNGLYLIQLVGSEKSSQALVVKGQ